MQKVSKKQQDWPYIKGKNFVCPKKHKIFDKNITFADFLNKLCGKNFWIQNKVHFHMKKTSKWACGIGIF